MVDGVEKKKKIPLHVGKGDIATVIAATLEDTHFTYKASEQKTFLFMYREELGIWVIGPPGTLANTMNKKILELFGEGDRLAVRMH